MLISLNWLKKYAALEAPPAEIAEALTSLGFEVEGLRRRGDGVRGVVAAEVLECGPHPHSEKLKLCRVGDGTGVLPVVCGAPNVATGQKVLLARVGATLAGGASIKRARIHGEESLGMICAEDEVGLGDGHEGILVLPPEARPGTPMQDIPGLCDVLFDVGVTPNRPDALCHLGMARELAAFFRRPLRYPEIAWAESGPEAKSLASIGIDDWTGCTLYTGRVITEARVGPSPEWLVRDLKNVGLKSINNVVDATNYVLLEFGQPSHAFDLDRIEGGRVVVRRAGPSERLRTLDHEERDLASEDLLIADARGPVCLAGVIGGEHTGVGEATRNIFLEVAYFNPAVVRRQARRHGVTTDSSYRFERGVDPLAIERVSDYLAGLIAGLTGGKVARGRLQKASPQHPSQPRAVYLRRPRAEKVLGISLGAERIRELLEGIEIRCLELRNAGEDETLVFSIPGFRVDLEREVDLIEEIARLYNLDNIPASLPQAPMRHVPLPPMEALSRAVRRYLADQGLRETLSLRFTSEKALDRLGLPPEDPRRRVVRLLNPLSEEWSIMPTTLLPVLLGSIAYNQNNQEPNVRFFETGRAYFNAHGSRADRRPGVMEEDKLWIVLAGEWSPSSWSGEARPVDYPYLKGIVEGLLQALEIPATMRYRKAEPFLHPAESARVVAAGAPGADPAPGEPTLDIGSFGMLHPRVRLAFDIKAPVAVAELSLTALAKAPRRVAQFRPFGQFSAVTREVNLVVAEAMLHEEVLRRFPLHELRDFKEVRLLGIYRGPGVPEGRKALHYGIVYQNPHRTLTDEEVNEAQGRLTAHLSRDPDIAFK